MSLYDSRDLMSFKAAAREFDVPVMTLERAVEQGALRVITQGAGKWLERHDVEQFVKRTIKRGAGNKVVTRIIR
jgi:predicted site-specific integrase-resolvase